MDENEKLFDEIKASSNDNHMAASHNTNCKVQELPGQQRSFCCLVKNKYKFITSAALLVVGIGAIAAAHYIAAAAFVTVGIYLGVGTALGLLPSACALETHKKRLDPRNSCRGLVCSCSWMPPSQPSPSQGRGNPTSLPL